MAYLGTVGLMFWRTKEEVRGDRIVIRLSQWQLEGSVRSAIDAIIARYEALNPHVRVEHIAVPDRVYLPWVQTQMVGGSGPDIVEYSWIWPNIARYFQSIDDVVGRPNPYNRGTPLEGVAWRDTNIDGMTNPDSFARALNRYYAITMTSHIPRIVYNRAMLVEITGRDEPPQTYREFLQLCTEVKRYAQAHHRPELVPLASSKDSYPLLLFSITGNALSNLAERLDHRHRLRVTEAETGYRYLQGEWSYDDPDLGAALQQLRELGEVSTPGFLQRSRDAALTDFLTERALMAVLPSWDASSLHMLCQFEFGAFRYPFPREDDPVYGRFTRGPFSEGPVLTGMAFYVNRTTKHRAQVIDFLHFLTSVEGSQIFTNLSHWQSATVGVKPSPIAAQFTQVTAGVSWGPSFFNLSGTDAGQFMRGELSALWNRDGSVEAYRAVVRAGLPSRLREDYGRMERAVRQEVCDEDTLAAARWQLAPGASPVPPLATVANEEKIYQIRDVLASDRTR